MCTNLRWIHNKYVDSNILVKCGYCKACLQEKANKRATRLKNEISSQNLALFVTLTYDRYSCPYIRYQDVQERLDPLPVYRDCSIRRDPVSHLFVRNLKTYEISSEDCVNYDYRVNYLPYLKRSKGRKIGVCIFKDVQDFNKRLRINLHRLNEKYKIESPNLVFDEKYRIYNTFEYGERTHRPHIHLLLFIKPSLYQVFKSAIIKSWPFADRIRTEANIQIARDAASYVASYVNCGSKLPRFIAANFPPKHSFSQGLGTGCDSFQLDSILKNVDRQNMSYNIKTFKDGIPCSVNLPVPKYVINRYFPLFKGYSRLTDGEIFDLLSAAPTISRVYEQIKKIDDRRMRLLYHYSNPGKKREQMIFWSLEDMFKIGTSLHNSYIRYKRITGKSAIDYAIDFRNTWSCYRNTIYKRFALDDEPIEYKFDNILSDSDLLTPRRLKRSADLADLYDMKCKTRDITNYVYSRFYYDV